MDILLSAVSSIFSGRAGGDGSSSVILIDRPQSARLTTDGYIPPNAQTLRYARDPESRVTAGQGAPEYHDAIMDQRGSGDDLEKLAWEILRRSLIVGVCYVGATQFIKLILLQEPSKWQVKATRKMLREKLPGRTDLNMERLSLNTHEISVANVSDSDVRRFTVS